MDSASSDLVDVQGVPDAPPSRDMTKEKTKGYC